jgi:hypothetical protein
MSTGPKNGTVRVKLGRVLALVAVLFHGPVARAEERRTDSVVLSTTLFRPPAVEPADKIYRDYFAGADEAIRLTYLDRWRFHELQSAYFLQRSNQVHLDIGAISNSNVGPLESDVRNEFARTAFRMRLESAFRQFLAHERAAGVRRAHKAVENLKAQNVRVSDEPGAAEIRMGYDVLSDTSRLEYVKGTLGAGLYHNAFLTAVSGSRPFSESLSLRVWKDFNNGLPSPYLSYAVGGRYVEAGLSKYFQPTVRGEVIAVKPTAGSGASDSVLLRMTYTF